MYHHPLPSSVNCDHVTGPHVVPHGDHGHVVSFSVITGIYEVGGGLALHR